MKELTFEDETIEGAYKKASEELQCFVADIKFEIVQEPSSGIFGLFKKNAIVKVVHYKKKKDETFHKKAKIKIQNIEKELDGLHKEKTTKKEVKPVNLKDEKDDIFDDFYKNDEQKEDEEKIVKEIKEKINDLFSVMCFNIDEVKVEIYNKETLFIEFNGEDAALLIGKEGYRYKALSYILFNWIYDKYGYKIRLEVAEFLKNQEEAIDNYLKPVFEVIRQDKFYKTKPLDGVLLTIALNKLKKNFPDMYVAVKTNNEGKKYIIINELKKYD